MPVIAGLTRFKNLSFRYKKAAFFGANAHLWKLEKYALGLISAILMWSCPTAWAPSMKSGIFFYEKNYDRLSTGQIIPGTDIIWSKTANFIFLG